MFFRLVITILMQYMPLQTGKFIGPNLTTRAPIRRRLPPSAASAPRPDIEPPTTPAAESTFVTETAPLMTESAPTPDAEPMATAEAAPTPSAEPPATPAESARVTSAESPSTPAEAARVTGAEPLATPAAEAAPTLDTELQATPAADASPTLDAAQDWAYGETLPLSYKKNESRTALQTQISHDDRNSSTPSDLFVLKSVKPPGGDAPKPPTLRAPAAAPSTYNEASIARRDAREAQCEAQREANKKSAADADAVAQAWILAESAKLEAWAAALKEARRPRKEREARSRLFHEDQAGSEKSRELERSRRAGRAARIAAHKERQRPLQEAAQVRAWVHAVPCSCHHVYAVLVRPPCVLYSDAIFLGAA